MALEGVEGGGEVRRVSAYPLRHNDIKIPMAIHECEALEAQSKIVTVDTNAK